MTVHFSLFLFSPTDGAATNTYNAEDDRTSTGSSVEHKFDNPIYGAAEELESNGTSQERMYSNPLYESSKMRHSSTSPPDHLIVIGTNDFTSHVTGPVSDSASYQDEDGATKELESKTGTGTSQAHMCSNPLYESTELLHPSTSPPDHLVKTGTTTSASEKVTSKSRAAYEEISDNFLGGDISSGAKTHSTPSPKDNPSVNIYSEIEGAANSVPPTVDPQVRPVYTNTLPGKITAEAESHYDLGQ